MAGASTVAAGVAGAGNALTALAAPAPQAGSFKEAPSLADQVKSGKLPAVDQRLPGSPRVVKPLERVGRHGGTWHRAYLGLSDRVGPGKLQEEQLIEWDAPNPTTLGLVPNFVEKWDQNADATEFTFYLRAGLQVVGRTARDHRRRAVLVGGHPDRRRRSPRRPASSSASGSTATG